MPARHILWLANDSGTRIKSLANVLSFSYTRVVNGLGAFEVRLPGDFDRNLVDLDYRVEFWRQAEDGPKRMEGLGFIRKWKWATDTEGKTTLTLSGPDSNNLLATRIVAYTAGSAQAAMTDQADDMMKAVITDNLGGDAAAARDITGNNFSIQADAAAGPSIDKRFAWRDLLIALQDISETAEANGTRVYFDCVPLVPPSIEFQTWVDQRGTDRTWPDGANPIRFGLKFGNLQTPSLTYDYTEEVTYVYAGGQGEGADRVTQEVEDTTRSGASLFNRREAFADARHCETTAGVQDSAYRRLNEGKPLIRFSGKLVDTESTRFGRDWFFGDLVTATYLGMQFNILVKAVTVSKDENGAESVDARFEVITS